jgi:uncharacterized membrane protein YqjE
MTEATENGHGVFESLRRLPKTFFSLVHNRLELLLVEFQEERWRFVNVLLLAGIALMLALMVLMVITVAIVSVCVRDHCSWPIIVLGSLYLLGALVSFWRLRIMLKDWEPFSATLAEFKKDKACLEEES